MDALGAGPSPVMAAPAASPSRTARGADVEAAGEAFAGILAAVPQTGPTPVAVGASNTSDGETQVDGKSIPTDAPVGATNPAATTPALPSSPATGSAALAGLAALLPSPAAAGVVAMTVSAAGGQAPNATESTAAAPATAPGGAATVATPALPVAAVVVPPHAAPPLAGTETSATAPTPAGQTRATDPLAVVSPAPGAATVDQAAPALTGTVTDQAATSPQTIPVSGPDPATNFDGAVDTRAPDAPAMAPTNASSGEPATTDPGNPGEPDLDATDAAPEAVADDIDATTVAEPDGATAPDEPLAVTLTPTTPRSAVATYVRVATMTAPAGNDDAAPVRSTPAASTSAARSTPFAATVDRALAALFAAGELDGDPSGEALSNALGSNRATGARDQGGASAIRTQVADQLSRGLLETRGDQKFTIRLQPENLGLVDAEFHAEDDRLTVVLRAATPEAEQALRSGARELSEAIVDRTGRFQHVEVRVEARDGATPRQERSDDRQQEQRHDGRQDSKRDGRDESRDRRTPSQNEARAAWARAWADLAQEG